MAPGSSAEPDATAVCTDRDIYVVFHRSVDVNNLLNTLSYADKTGLMIDHVQPTRDEGDPAVSIRLRPEGDPDVILQAIAGYLAFVVKPLDDELIRITDDGGTVKWSAAQPEPAHRLP